MSGHLSSYLEEEASGLLIVNSKLFTKGLKLLRDKETVVKSSDSRVSFGENHFD